MRVATIDCGTASIRLLIADVVADGENKNLREIFRDMEIVKLGEGVDTNKNFKLDAVERTLKVVDRYAGEIVRRGVDKVRFCAAKF